MSDDCKVCGEEGGMAEGRLGCKFNGCVHYVDQLEKVVCIVKRMFAGRVSNPELVEAIRKVYEMGKTYGRPFDWSKP